MGVTRCGLKGQGHRYTLSIPRKADAAPTRKGLAPAPRACQCGARAPEVRIMIDLYYWTTPNGHKITMFLEETGLPCGSGAVNINTGARCDPACLALSPSSRIPAIVDHDPRGGGAA